MAIEIRAASLEDADTVSAVLRRSITELCVADHENDEAVLADWLADKSPEAIREKHREARLSP